MRFAVAGLLVAALVADAGANGRDPYTSTITFRRGMESHIVAGMTFGVVVSKDGGATWQWMCERAVGYGGMYDPDYAYTNSGAIFATTFDGLKVMRDGCSFTSTPPGMTFVSKNEQGPDGALYYAAADPNDSKIYKSTDDGMTFPISAMPGMNNDWWQSIVVAPSDPNRVYLSGYRLVMKCTQNSSNPGAACTLNDQCPGGMCEPQKEFLLFKTGAAGLTNTSGFTAMSLTGIGTTSANSTIDIVGVDPDSADVLYAKVTLETGTSGDTIYKSVNAGASWTPILSKSSRFGLAFVARKDGTCVAGTRELGAWVSTNCDTNWTELTTAPHIGCLYENSAGEVWACTQNYESPQLGIASDQFGIMKSTDLATWTGVLAYQDIQAPVPCAAGTVQEDQCVQRYMDQQSQWCCLVPQLGITSTAIDCSGALACFGVLPDGALDAGTNVPPPPKGCCDTGSGSSALLGGLVAGALLLRRKRPKPRSTR